MPPVSLQKRSFGGRASAVRAKEAAKRSLELRFVASVAATVAVLLFFAAYTVFFCKKAAKQPPVFGPLVSFNQCVKSSHIALTFDDGPSVWTLALLDIFERYNVQATFFFVGANLERDPTNRRAAQLVVEKGHQVASHTWSHQRMTNLTAAENREELRKTAAVIESVTGLRPRYMRQPYGGTNGAVEAVIFAEGYKSMLWSCDSNDWRYTSEANVTAQLDKCDLKGLVVLMHEGRASTAEAVEKFIQRVRAEHPEKQFVRADECSGFPGDAYVPRANVTGPHRRLLRSS